MGVKQMTQDPSRMQRFFAWLPFYLGCGLFLYVALFGTATPVHAWITFGLLIFFFALSTFLAYRDHNEKLTITSFVATIFSVPALWSLAYLIEAMTSTL